MGKDEDVEGGGLGDSPWLMIALCIEPIEYRNDGEVNQGNSDRVLYVQKIVVSLWIDLELMCPGEIGLWRS